MPPSVVQPESHRAWLGGSEVGATTESRRRVRRCWGLETIAIDRSGAGDMSSQYCRSVFSNKQRLVNTSRNVRRPVVDWHCRFAVSSSNRTAPGASASYAAPTPSKCRRHVGEPANIGASQQIDRRVRLALYSRNRSHCRRSVTIRSKASVADRRSRSTSLSLAALNSLAVGAGPGRWQMPDVINLRLTTDIRTSSARFAWRVGG